MALTIQRTPYLSPLSTDLCSVAIAASSLHLFFSTSLSFLTLSKQFSKVLQWPRHSDDENLSIVPALTQKQENKRRLRNSPLGSASGYFQKQASCFPPHCFSAWIFFPVWLEILFSALITFFTSSLLYANQNSTHSTKYRPRTTSLVTPSLVTNWENSFALVLHLAPISIYCKYVCVSLSSLLGLNPVSGGQEPSLIHL